MKIRPAEPDDALPIAKVIIDTFYATYPGPASKQGLDEFKQSIYPESAARWRQRIEDIASGAAPRSCIYVAEDEGGVVGISYACPSKDESAPDGVGELDMLYIRESHQRQGIGTALVGITAEHLARLDVTTLHICTPTDHTQGRRFYEKLGGIVVATREDYEDGEIIPLVVYEWTDLAALVQNSPR